MRAIHRYLLAATVVAVLGGGVPSAFAAAGTASELDTAALVGRTLIWPDSEGTNQFIRLGRFGDFDRYVPCTIESGDWSLASDERGTQVLHLRFVNPTIAPQAYTLTRRDDGRIALTRPKGETFVAELAEGDRLPWP
jgi:hypothetical protein